jgi:uncharacterized coiled-coil protein SlyX
MPATDDEVRYAAEQFKIARERIDNLRMQKDRKQTDRTVLTQEIQQLSEQITEAQSLADQFRQQMKTLLNR